MNASCSLADARREVRRGSSAESGVKGRLLNRPRRKRGFSKRRGAATLDYVLVIGIVLPLALVVFRIAPRIMSLVYEMTYVFVSWPFM